MSDLRAEMSGELRICSVNSGYVRFRGRMCSVNQDNTQWKSRSGAKTMNLGLNKLMTSKQYTLEHMKIRGTTRCNLFTRNYT
jgi:hypothetical protein